MLNKILRLERSLVVIDLETTGLNPEVDRIIQIAVTIHYVEREPIAWSSLINPTIPILNTDKHKINDGDVEGKPTFAQVAPALAPKILNTDIMGYNIASFDLPFLKAEMKRAGVDWPWNGHIIDPLHIYRMRHGHNLSNAFKHYVDPKGFEGAHDAEADVKATEAVLIGQFRHYPDLPRTVKELSAFCFPHPENSVDEKGRFVWVDGEVAFNFGKFRGMLLKDPECRGYLGWMINKGDFSDEVKEIAQAVLDGKPPVKS
jgi:DNA polymerase-3 subunit epsilon